jgi:4-hydroxybenzoate polyprenyltransferase
MIRAMRPHQWLKNLLVFVPIIADPAHGGWEWSWALAAFVALSLAASAGYIINDLLDLRTTGPIRASATGPSRAATCRWRWARAWCRSCCCSVFGVASQISPAAGGRGGDLFRPDHGLFPAAEASFDHRHLHARRPLHDPHRRRRRRDRRVPVGLAAGLFDVHLLRARRGETAGRVVGCRCRGPHRDPARLHVEDRRILSQMAISAGYVGVLVLALYIDEPAVQERFGAHRLFWGVCALLIFWISRLVLVANRGLMDDDPLIWALKDPVSRATVGHVAAILIAGAVLL